MPVPVNLWKTAAFLYAIAIPGHVVSVFGTQPGSSAKTQQAGGLTLIHPLLNKIPVSKKEDRIGQRSAQNCYNYVNVSLAVAGEHFSPKDCLSCFKLMACLNLMVRLTTEIL